MKSKARRWMGAAFVAISVPCFVVLTYRACAHMVLRFENSVLNDPWYGRDTRLPRRLDPVTVGPIDLDSGWAGVFEFGMKFEDLVSNLGEPWVSPMSSKEAATKGIDPEYACFFYFFPRVYCWVSADDHVRYLHFKLRDFAKRFHSEQTVVLGKGGRFYQFGRSASRDKAIEFLHMTLGETEIVETESLVFSEQAGVTFVFDSFGKLSEIVVVR